MRAIRPGFLFWLLFALACVVPGWFLCEPLAAEVQIECGFPPIGRGTWRRLHGAGVWYLCRVLSDGPTRERRLRAADTLLPYADPIACKARLLTIAGEDRRLQDAALHGAKWGDAGEGLAGAFDAMNDEDLLGVLVRPAFHSDYHCLLSSLWRLRPERAERLVSGTLHDTHDLLLATELSTDQFGRGCFCFGLWFYAPELGEARLRALRAGSQNPDVRIRKLCEDRLAEGRERDGRR